MKKRLLLSIVAVILFSVTAIAQTDNPSSAKDPLDMSKQQEQIELYGVPTVDVIKQMKSQADSLYNAKNWQGAATAYEVFAKNANWMANLLTQCLEPYYGASYDDKKNVSYTTLKPLIPIEEISNGYKKDRDIAYIKIGLCYKNMGNNKNAVVYLYKGLDLLNIKETYYWTLARNAMLELLHVELPE